MSTRARTPIDMDGTLHTDFPKFETNRDIKTIIIPVVHQEEIKQKANITKQKTIGDFFKKP